MNLFAKTLVAVAIAASGLAQAATVSYGPVSYGPAKADWDSFLDLTKFNPTLGTLQSVTLDFTGTLIGDAGAENTSNRNGTASLWLQGNLVLQRADTTDLVALSSVLVNQAGVALAKYDGTTDFLGTSGKTFSSGNVNMSGNITLSSAADLALFSGVGSISLPVSAYADAAFSGPGNAQSYFMTTAGVSAEVIYNYAPVPEPGTYALMAAGLAAVGFILRRRQARS